jgi:peptide/nickel transport system substrate-binding protein
MHRRFWLSIAAVALGASLLASTAFAASEQAPRKGGTLRAMFATDVDFVDPALAYYVHSWQIMGATGAFLLRFPDREGAAGSRVVPEVAAGMPTVSRDGRTYTFTVRNGFRFSNGQPVTAANFAYAINRALNPQMQSPAGPFMADIVGAQAVLDGKARTASGIQVRGNRLTIRLTQVAPDFLARIAMPFFMAVPTNLEINSKGVQAPVHTAGPYYIASWERNKSLVLRRNPNYRPPAGALRRAANLDSITYTANVNLEAQVLRIRNGEADFGAEGMPPSAHSDLARQFGVNKSQYFVRQVPTTFYLAMNTSQPLFRDANMRKAVNYVIDRKAMLAQRGFLAGKRADQILPPGIPGFRDVQIYPLNQDTAAARQRNLQRARQLTRGRTGDALLLSSNRGAGLTIPQIVEFNLKQLGINVTTQFLASGPLAAKAGNRGEKFDMILIGWHADYPDPANFLDILLNGNNIREANNNNFAYFNVPQMNQRMEAAAKLTGARRYSAYGQLDIDITRNFAPWASYSYANNRDFVSRRVGCYQYHPTFSFNLATACIK